MNYSRGIAMGNRDSGIAEIQSRERSRPPHFPLLPLKQSRQQYVVRAGRGNPLDQPFHRRLGRHLRQPAPQGVHGLDLLRLEQLLLATRTTRGDVDGRIIRLSASERSSLISELPVPLNSSKITSSMRSRSPPARWR